MKPCHYPKSAHLLYLLMACLMTAATGGAVVAQEAPPGSKASTASDMGELQEVVVTATRREERLQDVPISVSAFNQEQIDQQGIRSIDELSASTPGVTFQRMGSSINANYNDEQSDINIRGIESQAGTSTTGIYIDDAPVQTRHIAFGSVNAFPALFDLERVEVLRGPQGTLFGSSAEGGAVRFITPEPGLNAYSGYVRSELATIQYGDTSYNLGGAAGGPIVDGVLGFRASFSFERDGGWVDRASYTVAPGGNPLAPLQFNGVTEPNSNWQQTATARLALKWAPTDNLSVTPSVYYQHLHINDTAAYWQSLSDPAEGIYRNGNALTNPSTDWFYLLGLKVSWNLPWASFTSSTSYFDRVQNSTSDYTQYERETFLANPAQFYYPAPGDATAAPFGDSQSNFFQEFRLASVDAAARFKWTAGLFYGHMNENVYEDIEDKNSTLNSEFLGLYGIPLCGVILGPCPNGLYLQAPTNRVIDEQLAAFGEATVNIVSHLSATLGLRVSHNQVSNTTLSTGGALVSNPGVVNYYSTSENPVTPKASLTWQPDRDNLYYATVAKGYRTGGINGPNNASICSGDINQLGLGLPTVNGVAQWPLKYASDSLWSYELGAKNTLLDRRLVIDSSIYLVRWNNIQQNVYLPDCGLQFIANLGHVESRGGDIDIQYRPIEALSLGLTASYQDAHFRDSACVGGSVFTGTACQSAGGLVAKPIVSEGNQLLGSPWSLHFSGEYRYALPVLGGSIGYARLDYIVLTAQNGKLPLQDARNAFFDTTIPGLPISRELGARAGVRFSGFDLSLFGENLTNEHPLMFLSRDIPPDTPASAVDPLYFARGVRPRTLGVTGTYRF